MNKFYNDDTSFSIEEHIGKVIPQSQHFHNLYEIYYLKEGEIAYFIDNSIYSVTEGDIVVIPPNTIHKTTEIQNSNRRRILLYLDQSFLDDFKSPNLKLWSRVSIIHTNKNERINSIFEELLSEQNGEGNSAFLKALTCELIILLMRKKEAKTKITENNSQTKRISEIITYINNNYFSDITLTKVAGHFFIHPGYLSKLFKDGTGMTFSDYLKKYRIKKSIELLQLTKKNVTEIAFDVGFNSTNHFCKAFKSVMNISPLKYRLQTQNNTAFRQ